jgi:hypothetical protein
MAHELVYEESHCIHMQLFLRVLLKSSRHEYLFMRCGKGGPIGFR